MSLTRVTEGAHALEFLRSEADGRRSRENIVIAASQTLLAGAILGKITQGAKTAAAVAGVPAPAGATITAAPPAALNTKVGVHRFVCIIGGAAAASKWEHHDPDGIFVGVATGNTAYAGGGLSALTITDTGTDPAVGEAFAVTVTMAAASGSYVAVAPAALDGSQHAAGILGGEPVTTGVGETADTFAIVRDAEVVADRLGYGALSTPQKATALADLAALGVIAR